MFAKVEIFSALILCLATIPKKSKRQRGAKKKKRKKPHLERKRKKEQKIKRKFRIACIL